jgi:hypothetical protein
MSLCPYTNILGRPKEGVHKHRVFDIAIVDVLLTIVGAFLISRRHFWIVLVLLFLSGIILHRLFCVRTTIDKFLFPNATQGNFLK